MCCGRACSGRFTKPEYYHKKAGAVAPAGIALHAAGVEAEVLQIVTAFFVQHDIQALDFLVFADT